jgi:hypothetical protein
MPEPSVSKVSFKVKGEPRELREAIAQKLGFNSADAVFADRQVRAGNRAAPLAEAAGAGGLAAEDGIVFVGSIPLVLLVAG